MQPCETCPHYVAEICSGPSAEEACADQTGRPCMATPCDRDLGAIFDRYHRHVVAWACRMTGGYDLATDLAQDVFVKALSGLDRFRGASRVSTWLYSVTRNCCLDYMKARACRPREVDERALLAAPPRVENAAIASLEAEQARGLVCRLMRDARLSPIEARAFAWHHGEDLPLEVVSARLGLGGRAGARARVVSARRKLRKSATHRQRLERRAALAPERQGAMTPWRTA